MDGFTDVLLPTDRWPWSDVTGMNPQPLNSFQLPSRSWEWEGDWYVDQSCGEPGQTGVRTTSGPASSFHFLTPFIQFLSFKEFSAPSTLFLSFCRAGSMLSTSQQTSHQTRSGTPVSVVDDGSVTEDTQHKELGQRFAKPY